MLTVLLAISLSSIPAPCLTGAAPQIMPAILGVARASDNSHEKSQRLPAELLYCEFHFPITATQWRVDYVQEGEIIATKNIDYGLSLLAPNITQTDLRTGELRSAIFNSEWQVSYKDNTASLNKTKILEADEVAVIDAGFDHFIRAQWQTLQAQPAISFPFLSIPHLKALMLRVELKPLDECALHSDAHACFKVGADNSFLRLFVGDIRLVYNQQKQLRLFEGVVNIQNAAGKSQNALIEYFY